jgi:hypothetical protein
MFDLVKELQLDVTDDHAPVPELSAILNDHVFELLNYDENGNFSIGKTCVLDLREGSFVKITSGQFAGDAGEVTTLNRRGHFRIRFVHSVSKRSVTKKCSVERVLGSWWLQYACSVKASSESCPEKFPIVNCTEEYATLKMKSDSWKPPAAFS